MKHRDIVAQIDEHIRRMTDSLALGLEILSASGLGRWSNGST